MADSETVGEHAGPGRVCPACDEVFPASFTMCPHDGSRLYSAADRPDDRLIGVVLAGTYRITKVLGEGGMARVYAAEHVRLGSRAAVKVIHEEIADKPEMLARFEREARAASRIRSDHVVRVIDVLQTPAGRPCMVTEMLEGEDLKVLLDREGRLKPAVALAIARQLCRAVAAAHREGVTHRDLKPSNVFLIGSGDELTVKVLDFGVAKLDGDVELTKTGALVGTLSYMAPEQAKRAADAGPLADIYTLGAVLYHMVTGQPPYGKDPGMNPLILLLGSEPEPPRAINADVPVGVEAVIQRAMARDPAQRPQSAEELDAELAAFSEPASRSTQPAPPARDLQRAEAISSRARRARPTAVALVAAAALLVGCYAAALVAALVTSGVEPRTGGERAMIALIGVAASAAAGGLSIRALRARWRSVPAVGQLSRTVGRAVLGGVVTLGALELAARGYYAIQRSPPDALTGGWTARLIATGAVAGIALFWPRLSRRARRRLAGR